MVRNVLPTRRTLTSAGQPGYGASSTSSRPPASGAGDRPSSSPHPRTQPAPPPRDPHDGMFEPQPSPSSDGITKPARAAPASPRRARRHLRREAAPGGREQHPLLLLEVGVDSAANPSSPRPPRDRSPAPPGARIAGQLQPARQFSASAASMSPFVVLSARAASTSGSARRRLAAARTTGPRRWHGAAARNREGAVRGRRTLGDLRRERPGELPAMRTKRRMRS